LAIQRQVITRANLKYFASLRHRKYRKSERLTLVEGRKPILEWLRSGISTGEVWITPQARELETEEDILQIAGAISPQDLQRISTLDSPEGYLAVISIPEYLPPLPDDAALCLVEVQDPGNLGTILRIADWFSIPQVWINDACADPWSPKVIRASMGSVFHTRICLLEDPIEFLKPLAERIIPTHLQGKPLQDFTWPPHPILLLGNEGNGLPQNWINLNPEAGVMIPGFGNAESLNIAVAAGILAWEAFGAKAPTMPNK